MIYSYLPNMVSQAVTQTERPYDLNLKVPSQVITKAGYNQWCSSASTQHAFISGVEGLNSALRVSHDNPPALIHGFVVDYDAEWDDSLLKTMAGRIACGVMPMWVYKTWSGRVRMIWEFETPFLVAGHDYASAFLRYARKEMNFSRIYPGFDKEAFLRVGQYYEVGYVWARVSECRIPAAVVHQWAVEATSRFNFVKHLGGDRIPIEAIAEAVHEKFRGRWSGDFVLGAQGMRFWDPSADNPRAAVVRENGMQCFTGPKAFVTWSEIFGPGFVRKNQVDRIGAAVANLYHDGKEYWFQDMRGLWQHRNQDNMKLALRVEFGLNPKGQDGDTSEVDKALWQIQSHGFVDEAVPLVHQQPGLVVEDGVRRLNISRRKVMQPCGASGLKWGEGFPWFARFLDGFFDDSKVEGKHSQLEWWLAWVRRMYVPALQQRMQKGHAVFVGGPTGVGKTWLSTVPLAKIMGGGADAAKFLLGKHQFNEHLYEAALWTVDDVSMTATDRDRTTFSANLKGAVANHSFEWNAKFLKSRQVAWKGRVYTTLNMDASSLAVLPDMDVSLKDKVILFRAADREIHFPEELDDIIASELPFFCRWIVEHKVPEDMMGASRFGINHFHEPVMLEHAVSMSQGYAIGEMLDIWRKSMVAELGKGKDWEGTTSELYSELQQDMSTQPLINKMTVVAFGRALSHYAASGGEDDGITRKGKKWRIDINTNPDR